MSNKKQKTKMKNESRVVNEKATEPTYKMYLAKSLSEKIREACAICPDVEWSGILFYKDEGSFKDGTYVIRALDMFPMDIGTTATTEFEMTPDVATHVALHEKLHDAKLGLVHSHQSFGVFFSGTDLATLEEEGRDTKNFVSLIVNNKGDRCARVTRRITKSVTDKTIYCDNEGGEDIIEQEKETIVSYPLDVIEPEVDSEIRDIFQALRAKHSVKANNNIYTGLRNESYHWDLEDDDSLTFWDPDDYMGKKDRPDGDLFDRYSISTKHLQKSLPQQSVAEAMGEKLYARLITGDVFYEPTEDNGKKLHLFETSLDDLYMDNFPDIELEINITDRTRIGKNYLESMALYAKGEIDVFEEKEREEAMKSLMKCFNTKFPDGKSFVADAYRFFLNYEM